MALSADVVEGIAPLTVNLTGQLVGGPDNNRDYYCVESAFEFGDGMVQSAIPGCVEWTPEAVVQREYSASYVYDEPGVYQATFSLGGSQSESLTIVVHNRLESTTNDEPITSENTDVTRTAGETRDDSTGGPERSASRLCLSPMGLLMLPLLGVVFARRRSVSG